MPANYYDKIKNSKEYKHLFKELPNPGYKKTHYFHTLPLRIVCVGPSGSGKSNFLLSFINVMSGTFTRIIICCQSKDEPLYNYLEEKLPDIEFYEGIENVPDLNDIDKEGSTLTVFDDFAAESRKAHAPIEEYYLRGRKKNVSCVYLTQNFFNLSKLIRGNLTHCVFKTLSNIPDLRLCIRQYSLERDLTKILDLYRYSNSIFENFFLIDLSRGKYYCNFIDKLN